MNMSMYNGEWVAPGMHQARQHKATICTDKTKDEAVALFEREHPECVVKTASSSGGWVDIWYTKKADEEAAKQRNENPPQAKRVGSVEDHRPNSLSKASRGIEF